MDPEEHEKLSTDMEPVEGVGRLEKKRPVKRGERPPLDIARMRLDAWRAQRRAQLDRIRNKVNAEQALENITAAADLELAGLGFPYVLKLEKDGEKFNWALYREKDGAPAELYRKSERFMLSGEDAKSIGLRLSQFISSIGTT